MELSIRRDKVASVRTVLLGFLIALVFFIPGCTKKPEGGATTIRFVTWKPNQPEVWDEIIGNFERKHPQIKVEREIGPHSSTAFHDLLTQKLKNRSKDVDVFFMDVTWPPEFASAGWALPLDGRFPPAEREKFLAGPVAADTYKGSIYGIPLFIDAGMLYYLKDLLKKYGYVPPMTWPENPQFADMRGVFMAAYPRPRTPLYPTVSNILQRYFSKAISDAGMDIEREAKGASAEIDRMLELIK